MYNFFLFLFIVNTFILMITILMQSDKSGGLSSTFGGVSGAASSTFGTRETVSFLHKLTIILTTSFFVLAIVIGLMSKAEFRATVDIDQSLIMQKGSEAPLQGLPSLDRTTLPEVKESEPVENAEIPAAEPEQK
ncbi:MAG: preprotein translocase subunit SecG [Candidatus Delongbacteria bacterium]|jgi:preprotein translocase subunit SecG|nr:preprotein translocase subunit SecG [Candidatus Delongbacteria bacterium]MDD4204587.1 preprotein translocase subunit SecG [Candidatus Delongbacteria bacterium]MDY0017792.1 preprotein translocase subunit SecG [Candidatus Delongbacteria bacterium]